MPNRSFFIKINPSLAHLPTWLLIIGFPMYWLDLYVIKTGQGMTSCASWVLFVLLSVGVLWSSFINRPKGLWRTMCTVWYSLRLSEKILWALAGACVLTIISIVLVAGFKPIHLIQEFDALQYHYTLPRQHLILESFSHIPWAADDLFLLPINFALAPFWFTTTFPNKFPQLIFLFGLGALLARLSFALASNSHRYKASVMVIFAFVGSHGLGIQMGTAMLDLVIVYLFFATCDSLRLGQWWLAGVEFTFFMWSKPFMPIQVFVIVLFLIGMFWLFRFFKWEIRNIFPLLQWQKCMWMCVLLSIVVAGPFIYKSIYYSATPLFPFAPGIMGTQAKIQLNPIAWNSLSQASTMWMSTIKNGYGYGIDIISFFRHWWFLAVPDNGVNNAFDYPMGLPYLLLLAPFLFFLFQDIRQRKFCLLSWLIIVMWIAWWFGSQQTRFLFIPVLIMFIITTVRIEKISRALLAGLVIALMLNSMSLFRAHKDDFFLSGWEVLRNKDKLLMSLNTYNPNLHIQDVKDWPSHDVAYAQFPVRVKTENLPHTILF